MNTSSTSIVVVVVAVVVVLVLVLVVVVVVGTVKGEVVVVVKGEVVVVKGEVVVVAGSVIGCLWNSVRSPEHELLEQLCAFRGCGRICHWLLVEFRPQPRKRAFGAIVCFSGLW